MLVDDKTIAKIMGNANTKSTGFRLLTQKYGTFLFELIRQSVSDNEAEELLAQVFAKIYTATPPETNNLFVWACNIALPQMTIPQTLHDEPTPHTTKIVERCTERAIRSQQYKSTPPKNSKTTHIIATIALIGLLAILALQANKYNKNDSPLNQYLHSLSDTDAEMLNNYLTEDIPEY